MRITDGAAPVVPPEIQPHTNTPHLSDPGGRTNLYGVAVNTRTAASVNRSSGDLEIRRIETLDVASRDTELLATTSSSIKVKTAAGDSSTAAKQEGESTDGEPNFVLANTSLNLLTAQGGASASLASATFSNRYASLIVSAFGAQASGQASVGLTHDGITAQASGDANVYLAAANANLHAGPVQASADASVGADVNANAQLALNPVKGDVDANAGVGAFAGAQANETASVGADGTSVSETANVGAGVGFDAKMDVGLQAGKVEVSFDVGAYLGIGGGADASFSVNVPKLADSAWHDITSFL